jgi:23S rRNA pseudouridine2605 synthase
MREQSPKQSEREHPKRHNPGRRPDGESRLGKLERLQKVLAHAGVGSRRSCEVLIKQGRISVDGQVIRELGTRVDPDKARIAVDGEAIRIESMVYYAVNKPKGYVSTNVDPAGRPRVVDLLPEIPERVYTVGRLDEESTGLMILTNDGELANRLAHPRYGVEKLYRALVAGSPDQETLAKLTAGVWLSDGKLRAKRARLVGRQGQANVLELVLAEGKNREIRRMLAKLGHKVMSLNRVAVGPISMKGLASGEWRSLSRHEVDLLWKVATGASVSLPRFLSGESPAHTRRISSRQYAANHIRAGRGRATGPPRENHGDSVEDRGAARAFKQSKSPLPPRSNQYQPERSRRRDTAPRRPVPSQGPSRRNSAGDRGSARPIENSPPQAKRRAVSGHESPFPAPAKRRIIGLEPQPPTGAGKHFSGTRGRKRPPPRRNRSSLSPPQTNRTSVPSRPRGPAGENA